MVRSKRSVEKEQFWRLVLEEHVASGLSIKAFCDREAVAVASLYYWRRALAIRDGQSVSNTSSPEIVPVRVVDPELNDSQTRLTQGCPRPEDS